MQTDAKRFQRPQLSAVNVEREGNEILQFKVYAESLAVIVALGKQETSRSVGGQPLNLGDVYEVLHNLI